MNKLSANSYTGTRDFYPQDMVFRNWMFKEIEKVLHRFNYDEVNGPILESYKVFAAKSGEEIVQKQMYSFEDKGNRKVVIRPEMTPTVARMISKKQHELNFPIRWYSIANFMRYERPQKGRLREFYQVNVDLVGSDAIETDLEIISIGIEILKQFKATSDMFEMKINNRMFLYELLEKIGLNENQTKEAIAIIDKKNKITKETFESYMAEVLPSEKVGDFLALFDKSLEELLEMVDSENTGRKAISYLFFLLEKNGYKDFVKFDLSIVRGLAYYTGNIFELYDKDPDNKRAIFGGGRYDDLVSLFSKEKYSGIGFGMGDVVLQSFIENHGLISKTNTSIKCFIAMFPDVCFETYHELLQKMHAFDIPTNLCHNPALTLKKQLHFADKNSYTHIILLGALEKVKNVCIIKDLKASTQTEVNLDDLKTFFEKISKNA